MDPLGQAAAALDLPRPPKPGRRASRGESRAQARAERGAEKLAAKNARKLARQHAADEPVGDPDQLPVDAGPVDVVPADTSAATDEDSRLAPTERLVARLPAINPLVAAILTGVFSGLVTVLLAFGAARGCESVRGTDSCGGGLGLLALLAILAIEVLIGAKLLNDWQNADPYSSSFLGVGVVATVAMLGFLSHIDSPWMLLVIPLMTGASFALSWWVTVRFIDEYDPDHPQTSQHDEAEQDEDANA